MGLLMLIEAKKQNKILSEMAVALEASGVLPSPNALMDADANASDPMVQMYVGFSSALSEAYLQLENLQNQLDYRTANAQWLTSLHGSRFGVDLYGKTEADARSTIEQLDINNVKNGDPVTAVMTAENVAFAKAIYGEKTMLIVQNKQGQTIPDGAIARALYEGVPAGFYEFVGDKSDTYIDGTCHTYNYQPAERVIIGLEVKGEIDPCLPSVWGDLANQIVQTFNCDNRYKYGETVRAQDILQQINKIDGLKLTSVKIQKRGAKFSTVDCPPELIEFYDCDGALESVDFTNSNTSDCANSAGYFWCDEYDDCVQMKPWEYPVLHPEHITFIDEVAEC